MTVVEYVAYFYELAGHVTSILDIDYKRACFFVKRLRLPICMAT